VDDLKTQPPIQVAMNQYIESAKGKISEILEDSQIGDAFRQMLLPYQNRLIERLTHLLASGLTSTFANYDSIIDETCSKYKTSMDELQTQNNVLMRQLKLHGLEKHEPPIPMGWVEINTSEQSPLTWVMIVPNGLMFCIQTMQSQTMKFVSCTEREAIRFIVTNGNLTVLDDDDDDDEPD
jgi:hypothetical protein